MYRSDQFCRHILGVTVVLVALWHPVQALAAQTSTPEQQRHRENLALVDLYHATNGVNRINNSSWLGESGTIPETFGNESFLSIINPSFNLLTGNVPDSLGNLAELRSLKSLYLQDNQLNGRIPPGIASINNKNLDNNRLERDGLQFNWSKAR